MVEDKLNTIIGKEHVAELMPLLRSLTKEEKKDLTSHVKALSKEYLEFRQNGTSWRQKASPVQANMIYATAFVCLNRKEYQKFDSFAQIINNNLLNDVLNWYCPDWFSDYVNDLTRRDWLPWNFQYDNAVEMTEKGYLTPADELIARLIPQIIFERNAQHKFIFAPQNLEKRRITLEKHIWLIFQFETSIHASDRYMYFENSNAGENRWINTLRSLTTRGLLDRNRMLKESLLAPGRNFNKALSAWFVDLFESMEATKPELLSVQPELLNALNSKHSRAVNGALNGIKSIIEEKEFNIRGFLDHAPVLLSSETKSIVSTTLSLFEKLLRKNPSFKEEVCIATCQAFIHQEENIQTRACKLLIRYKDNISQPILTDELARYAESLLMSSKKMLTEFISADHPSAELTPASSGFNSSEVFKTVETPTSLDELIFLSSQAFDNNDPLHIDLLPAALVNMQDQLTGSMLHKFEPALQRAYTFVVGDWRSTMGYLDHLLATFFIDLTWLLIDRFPNESASLKQIHETFKRKDNENMAKFSHSSRIPQLHTWSVNSRDNTYVIHKTILLIAFERIKGGKHLPLLSTPTHEQGYLDPLILVKRLTHYQNKNELLDEYDLQLAVSRVAPFNHGPALEEARRTLKGEILNIIEFLLNKDASPEPPFSAQSVWFIAGVTKSPRTIYSEFNGLFYNSLPRTIFTGDVPWKSFVEHYKITRYNFQKKRNDEVPSQRQVLRLTLTPPPTIWQEPEKPKNVLSKLAQLISSDKKDKRSQSYVLYEFLSLKAQWLSAEHNDIQRFIYLFPSNPNPLLALVASRSLQSSTLSSESDKRMLTKTLESLVNLKFQWSEITHVFIASCVLTSDKTVRSFAGELWINAVVSGSVASNQVGRIIGTHFTGEYAPLKRFTDLISESLLKISATHNSALESMLTGVIEELSAVPPVGTKRLLELYSEIILMNESVVAPGKAMQKLSAWNSSSGLKKVISSLPLSC